MPLIKNIPTPYGATIQVWKDEETLDFFLKNTKLSSEEEVLLAQYTNERRKKDLLIARYLLQRKLPDAIIAYHPSGKPYLQNNEAHISISHTKDLVSISLHPRNAISIDIEYISPRVEKVKHRFLSDQELKTATSTKDLTLYWSAKETLFKLDKEQGLDFREDLELSQTNIGRLYGKIRQGSPINVHYHYFGDWIMTHATVL